METWEGVRIISLQLRSKSIIKLTRMYSWTSEDKMKENLMSNLNKNWKKTEKEEKKSKRKKNPNLQRLLDKVLVWERKHNQQEG